MEIETKKGTERKKKQSFNNSFPNPKNTNAMTAMTAHHSNHNQHLPVLKQNPKSTMKMASKVICKAWSNGVMSGKANNSGICTEENTTNNKIAMSQICFHVDRGRMLNVLMQCHEMTLCFSVNRSFRCSFFNRAR